IAPQGVSSPPGDTAPETSDTRAANAHLHHRPAFHGAVAEIELRRIRMAPARMTIEPQAGAASGRPWGPWISIAWVVAAVALWLLVSFWIVHAPSPGPGMGFVLASLSWAIAPVVLVIAVLVRRLSIASYMAWTVPRPSGVLIAVGAALVAIFGIGVLDYV